MSKTKRAERMEQIEKPIEETQGQPIAIVPEGEEGKFNNENLSDEFDTEFETITSGASFIEWEEGQVEIMIYSGEKSIRQKDGAKADQKKGDIMGYLVTLLPSKKDAIIGATKAIKDAFEVAQKGDKFRITFLGNVPLDGGHSFNSFKIEKAKPKA